MRSMLLAISAASLATLAGAAQHGDTNVRTLKCPNDPAVHHARPGQGAKPHKLTDLPPAEAYRAVYRRGPDGCVIPVKFNDRPAPPRP